MASMSTKRASSSSSSSSSSFIPGSKYDVFLSFRGEDTRNSFTDHLYTALKQKGIFTFRDDERLERGRSISLELSKAIEESRFAIVILSSNYASSTWCLDELAKVMGCKKEIGMIVLPIFYDVDPSDVRKQTGIFAQAFVEHEEHFKENIEKVQKWRATLREVANLSGWHLQDRSETKFIQDIVKVILNHLNYPTSIDTKGLVGIKSRVEKLKSHLAIESNDVRFVGIWGTGGMGKTTLARVVYNMVSTKFEACSFITNVREESEKCGLRKIQQILLKELLNHRDLKVQDVDKGVLMIKNRLCNKKILLVLDDVNELDQLKKLVGEHCWFGLGSRVMITTRDKHLLVTHEVNEIYEAEVLNDDEALQLFSLEAFKMDHPAKDYVKLSQAFVDYSKGLPLALEVLGSFLFNKSIDEWKSELDRLKEFPERKILDVLQISFNGLQATEKEIFLNIACFYNHKNQDKVIEILDYLELYPKIGLRVLIDKSLVKLHKNQLWMHNLLQEMGRDIVHQECRKDPGKCSRLWLFKDIDNVLTKNTGSEAIKGMVLELPVPKKVDWNPEAFLKMHYLKLLKIHGVRLTNDLKHLPNSLRFLDWKWYPSKSLPSSFQSNELVELHMCCSYIERLWKGTKSFEKLKFIDLRESLKLIETPDIIIAPNLERLVLEGCINLPTIHPSIGIHKKLTVLNLKGCKNLKSLPSKFEMECLKFLSLSGCSKIKEIPEFGRNMKLLDTLNLNCTAITKLPTSIEHLTDLNILNLRDCKNLVCLPSTICSLKLVREIDLTRCSKLDRLPENLGNAKSVRRLYVSSTAIRNVPSSIGLLKNLDMLSFSECKGLSSSSSSNKLWYWLFPFNSLPRSPDPMDMLLSSLSGACSLTNLYLRDCNLKAISNDIGSLFSLESLDLSGNDFVCLPESIIRLSNLKCMYLNNCTSLQSLPKVPLNIESIYAEGCISLDMLPDQLKPNNLLEPSLYLENCFKLADSQGCINMFIAGIKKSLKRLPHPYDRYETFIPGSKIPEWFSHQSIGAEVNIKQHSYLCNEWMGFAICIVFCSHDVVSHHQISSFRDLSCCLIANGKRMSTALVTSTIPNVLSDHLWLLYVTPQFFNEYSQKLLLKGDANGFSQIAIKIETKVSSVEVKKCGFRVVYKKDMEDLNQTIAQYSNSSIAPYEGLDVLHHNFNNWAMVVERHKVKHNRDDYDGAGLSGEGSSNDVPYPKRTKRIEFMAHGKCDCGEEASDSD